MNWTQVEAADKLGYSASLVSGIETMDKTPTADFAARCDTVFATPGTFATMRDLVAAREDGNQSALRPVEAP
jgi:transcriptional regulator with XRE-family HTH domain